MKQIIFILFTGMALFLASCGGGSSSASSKGIEIAPQNGLYGLKQGSKWVANPVYTKLVSHQFESGTFFIAQRVPGTQKYYHVIFDSSGNLLKECNIYTYTENRVYLITPEEPISYFDFGTMEEKAPTTSSCSYIYDDIFAGK